MNYNLNPPEPLEYILRESLETDPNDISIYTIEEHLYEQKQEEEFIDFEEIRIKELIPSSNKLELNKNEGKNTAPLI